MEPIRLRGRPNAREAESPRGDVRAFRRFATQLHHPVVGDDAARQLILNQLVAFGTKVLQLRRNLRIANSVLDVVSQSRKSPPPRGRRSRASRPSTTSRRTTAEPRAGSLPTEPRHRQVRSGGARSFTGGVQVKRSSVVCGIRSDASTRRRRNAWKRASDRRNRIIVTDLDRPASEAEDSDAGIRQDRRVRRSTPIDRGGSSHLGGVVRFFF